MAITARKPKAAKRAKPKKAAAPKAETPGKERVYTQLEPADKAMLDKIADSEERSTMQYLRLLILRDIAKHKKKKGN